MLQGAMTLSQEQLKRRLRRSALAGHSHAWCTPTGRLSGPPHLLGVTEIEHALGATDDDLKLMAEKGTYFDPQAGLLLETHLSYKKQVCGHTLLPED